MQKERNQRDNQTANNSLLSRKYLGKYYQISFQSEV